MPTWRRYNSALISLVAGVTLFHVPPVISARYIAFLFGVNMSGSKKPRSVANPLETALTTPSERILKECHSLYIDDENGKILNSDIY